MPLPRRFALLLAIVTTASLAHPPAARPQPQPGAPVVIVAEVDGIIHPVTAEFMTEAIERADTSGARLMVFVLRTPGGLLDSTRTIVGRIIAARTPVVTFVAPSGARAASAGFIIVLASDVAAMAPGTHIGAAHPVSGSGEQSSETMAKKAAEDVAAYARSLAEARGRNVALAASAVIESRAFTDREALQAKPPLIDVVAADLPALIRELDGRTITRFDGRRTTIETTGATTTRVEMSWRQRFLSAIAHPQIAYLLLSLGILGLTVELWNPGAIVPGVAGGVSLLLAFFAFQVLPVNTTGVLLVVFGLALLLLELKMPSFGVLGVGGTISLVLGSVMLTSTVPGVPVSLGFVVPLALGVAAIFLFLGRLALAAQRQRAVTGAEGLIGLLGRTLEPVGPGTAGQVVVRGEIWRATSATPLGAGRPVRIVSLDGLTARVEPVDQPLPEGDPR